MSYPTDEELADRHSVIANAIDDTDHFVRYRMAHLDLVEAALRFCRESVNGDERGLHLKAQARGFQEAMAGMIPLEDPAGAYLSEAIIRRVMEREREGREVPGIDTDAALKEVHEAASERLKEIIEREQLEAERDPIEAYLSGESIQRILERERNNELKAECNAFQTRINHAIEDNSRLRGENERLRNDAKEFQDKFHSMLEKGMEQLLELVKQTSKSAALQADNKRLREALHSAYHSRGFRLYGNDSDIDKARKALADSLGLEDETGAQCPVCRLEESKQGAAKPIAEAVLALASEIKKGGE